MHLSPRAALVRNLAVAFGNGLITLIILLIAPMGLLAVIVNTGLVATSTFFIATAADRIVIFLLPAKSTQAFVNASSPISKNLKPAQSLDRPQSHRD